MNFQLNDEIKDYIQRKEYASAIVLLERMWENIAETDDQEIGDWIYFNSLLPMSKRINMIALDQEKETDVLGQLKMPIWYYVAEHVKKNAKRIKPIGDYRADPEDKGLIKLVQPFLGKEAYQLPTMGVRFASNGTYVTDRIGLLYLTKKRKGKKGTYCVTKKCFDELHDGETQIKQDYPNVAKLFSESLKGYEHSLVVEIEVLRFYLTNLIHLKMTHSSGNGVILDFTEGNLVYVHARKLLMVLDAAKMLGWEKVKMWIKDKGRLDAIVFTDWSSTKDDFAIGESHPRKDLMLLMPMALFVEVGMPVIALGDMKLWHVNNEGFNIDITEVKPDSRVALLGVKLNGFEAALIHAEGEIREKLLIKIKGFKAALKFA